MVVKCSQTILHTLKAAAETAKMDNQQTGSFIHDVALVAMLTHLRGGRDEDTVDTALEYMAEAVKFHYATIPYEDCRNFVIDAFSRKP